MVNTNANDITAEVSSFANVSQPKIAQYEPRFEKAYLAFAARSWGAHSYQASPRYLAWMYDRNPLAKPGRKDIILAVRGDDVIGCLHKMRLSWRSGGDLIELPTSHNWMVAEADRKGIGTMMLMAGLRDRHVFVPSAKGPLAEMFRALKGEEIRPSRKNWVLRPLQTAARVGLARLAGPERIPHEHRRHTLDRAPVSSYGDVRCDPAPSLALQQALLECWNVRRGDHSGPAWDERTFAWRFFDSHGPRHVAIYAGHPRVDGFLLFSISLRRGLLVAHLQEMAVSDRDQFQVLFRAARKALRSLHVHMLIVFSADSRVDAFLADERLAIPAEAAPAFVVHANRKTRFGDSQLLASACDLGFESITTWTT